MRPVRLVVRTPPFHGGNTGSSPVRVATLSLPFFREFQRQECPAIGTGRDQGCDGLSAETFRRLLVVEYLIYLAL